MPRQVSSILEPLAGAIDDLDLPTDGVVLTEAFALADRLNAKFLAAVGGATTLDNLTLVCSRHHHLLHSAGWHAKLLPDATLEITDPQGRVHTTTPPDPSRAPPLPLRE